MIEAPVTFNSLAVAAAGTNYPLIVAIIIAGLTAVGTEAKGVVFSKARTAAP